MKPSRSTIFTVATTLAERRAAAESYLLRIILSAPAETATVLRSLGARADMIDGLDYRVMMREVLAMGHRKFSQMDALDNVMVGLRESDCWDLSATAAMQGPRWTVRGLAKFATWFAGGVESGPACRRMAASAVGVAWARVRYIDLASREAMRCWTTARRIVEEVGAA